MNDLLYESLAFAAGVALGLIFFGGLWFTVQKAMNAKIPALWFFGSIILRVSIVLLGFYAVMQRTYWVDGLICLLGFIAARFVVIHLTKTHELRVLKIKKEALHET